MLNMYFSVLNCRAGFPEQAGIKLIPFRVLGTIEDAVNQCVSEFETFADQFSNTAPFAEHKSDLIDMARSIITQTAVVSRGVNFRREDGKLIQRVLIVSVRSGDDIPTRRY